MSFSIADLLAHYGADTTRLSAMRSGWQPVKCPWHEDRIASASVSTERNAFVCHACGIKGDVLAVIERIEGLDYLGAVEWAREVLGAGSADLPHSAKRTKRRRPTPRQRLFD